MTFSKPPMPSHAIYTGSFAALEWRWIQTVAELQEKDPLLQVDVLVGSNILASYLKRCLAQSGSMAANVRFYTFLDLARRLAAPFRDSTQPRLPSLGASILLESILADNTPSFYREKEVSGYRGFRDALLETFRDLRDAGFTPAELDRAVQRNRNADRREHLLAFAELYRKYRQQVGSFHDVDEDFRSAIRNPAPCEVLSGGCLLVYGIYDVTGQQARLLAALKDSLSLIYFIPFVDDRISEFAKGFLENRSRELNAAPVRVHTPATGQSLGILAARGFGLSPDESGEKALPDDGSVVFISAPGESRAAVEIVREIFRAIRDGTISGFHEAAVVLRQPENDIPVLTEMFRLRGVPYFIEGGCSFAERPLGKAVVALGRAAAASFSREAVLAALELAAAALPEEARRWDVQSWRALTNDPRFLAGLDAWDSGTEALIEDARLEIQRLEERSAEDVEEKTGAGAPSIGAARRRMESAIMLKEAWQLIRQAAAEWPASLSWREWALFLEQRMEPMFGGSEDWPIFSAVLDELGTLSALGESIQAPADRVRSSLLEAISSKPYPVGRFQRSGVNILSTSAARGLRFPLVILPGLDEGRFPARLRQDPLLLDAERSAMGALPIKSKRIEEEKLLFDMAARSAEKRLVLMTSRLDESSDRERIPSRFFLQTASAASGKTVTIRDLTPETVPGFRSVSLDSPAPAKDEIPVDHGEIRLRIITADRRRSREALDVLAQAEPARLRRPLQYDRARWEHRLTSFDGRIRDPQLVGWIAEKFGASAGQVSASRLEEYVKCPYAFFLNRVMDLQAWEEQAKVEGMNPLERGLLIHSVLDKFLAGFGERAFTEHSAQELRSALESQARSSLESARPTGMADLLWEIERDSLISMLGNWIDFEKKRADDDGDMDVARLEQAFGEFKGEEKLPAFRVTAGRHTFEFRGRIDRVDFSPDRRRARVIDYKTGVLPESMANKEKRSPLMSGERIQIVVYAGALSILEGFDHVETIEGEYLHLQPKNGQAAPCSFSHEELLRGAQSLPRILEAVGDGIEAGAFFARTSGRVRPYGHCDFCDYLPVCGKDRGQREERKATDPAVRGLLQIVEPL